MICFAVKSQNDNNKVMASRHHHHSSPTGASDRGGLRATICFWLTLLALCQCLSGGRTTAAATSAPTAHRRWSLAELSVTSSELPKQIPAPPYPQQQRIQSTPHYDQQLKLPSGNGAGGSRHHYYPWTQPTVSVI